MKDFKELQKELKESESKIKNIEFTSVELLKLDLCQVLGHFFLHILYFRI